MVTDLVLLISILCHPLNNVINFGYLGQIIPLWIKKCFLKYVYKCFKKNGYHAELLSHVRHRNSCQLCYFIFSLYLIYIIRNDYACKLHENVLVWISKFSYLLILVFTTFNCTLCTIVITSTIMQHQN